MADTTKQLILKITKAIYRTTQNQLLNWKI